MSDIHTMLTVGTHIGYPLEKPIDAIFSDDRKSVYVYFTNPLNRFIDLIEDFVKDYASVFPEAVFIRDINSIKLTNYSERDYKHLGIQDFLDEYPEAANENKDVEKGNFVFLALINSLTTYYMMGGREVIHMEI